MFCMRCGKEIESNSDYCKYCGNKQKKNSYLNKFESFIDTEWIRRIFNWLYCDENRKRSLIIEGILAFTISLFIMTFGTGYIPLYALFILFPVWYFELGVVIPFLIGLVLDIIIFLYLIYWGIKNK